MDLLYTRRVPTRATAWALSACVTLCACAAANPSPSADAPEFQAPESGASPSAGDVADNKPPPAGSYLALSDDRYGAFRFAPNAPHIGDNAPELSLTDIRGESFRLADATGPVMVMFYRGFW